METYEGFKIVNMKFEESSQEMFQIFWKPHTVREYVRKKPGGRTLFIINIPAFVTKQSLQEMMEAFGTVVNVYLQKKPSTDAPPSAIYPILDPEQEPKGYKVSYVVFKESKALKNAMNFSSDKVLIATNQTPILTGLEKWYKEYNEFFTPEQALRDEVKLIISDYDERKEREKQAVKKAAVKNAADKDGWITVVSKKRLRPANDGRTKKGPVRKRKKKAPLVNFYNFQKKEINLKHLDEKRKKFEEDGRRMALLRISRKFKPL